MSTKIRGILYCPICGKVAAHLEFDKNAAELVEVEKSIKEFDDHIRTHTKVALAAYAPALKEAGAILLAIGAAYQFVPITSSKQSAATD